MLHQWHGTIDLIRRALAEDEAAADATSGLLPADMRGTAIMLAKQNGVIAGVEVGLAVFREVDLDVAWFASLDDGTRVEAGQHIVTIKGRLASILRAERTALNFVQRMSGIATATRAYVDEIAGTNAALIDTRKTLPGLRLLDKYSVRMGGGRNHRMSLADGVLIKDNHIAAAATIRETIADLVARARATAPHTVRIEVECDTLEQVRQSVEAGADIVMLDNMSIEIMREAVSMCAGRVLTEASGGVTLAAVRTIAETGVDFVSAGAITHSVQALDISLDVTPDGAGA
jgi:nicotinate-nucleotide pyrophosphorylase (carboxylating)